jgi:LysR family hydrogen peroxide-inducible transcriptional activator
MNLRTLKYLIALAEHQHFGRAAKASYVSQPTLSMQVKKLEEELGVQLLERTNKSVLLTSIGKKLADQARTIVQLTDELKKTARLEKNPYEGELRIGLIPTVAPYLLPHIIPMLNKKFPKLTLLLQEEKTEALLTLLKHGQIDVAIAAIDALKTDFVEMPLYEESFLLAVSPQHKLASQKTVQLKDLENESLLLLTEGHCLRTQALDVCRHIKTAQQKNFQATSLETLRYMVASNVGVTLMPKLAAQKNDGIIYFPFAKKMPSRTIGMWWRKACAQENLLREMAECVVQISVPDSFI